VANGETYSGDPLHDPRVIAVLSPAHGDTERREVIAAVTAEYRAAAEAKRLRAAAEARAYHDQLRAPLATTATLPGHLVGGNAPAGSWWDPVAHRLVGGQQDADPWADVPGHRPGDVTRIAGLAPSLGGESMPIPPEVLQPPPRPEDCAHEGQAEMGARFCTRCGQDLTGQQHDQAPLFLPEPLPPERPDYWTGDAGEDSLPPGLPEPPDLPSEATPREDPPT
jgi:hypothetical protein